MQQHRQRQMKGPLINSAICFFMGFIIENPPVFTALSKNASVGAGYIRPGSRHRLHCVPMRIRSIPRLYGSALFRQVCGPDISGPYRRCRVNIRLSLWRAELVDGSTGCMIVPNDGAVNRVFAKKFAFSTKSIAIFLAMWYSLVLEIRSYLRKELALLWRSRKISETSRSSPTLTTARPPWWTRC